MNSPAKNNLVSRIWDLISPVVENLGCRLWDVEYLKEGADHVLRITIDKDEGISIDDCEKVHRAIDPVLDENDPISDPYRLEVSSPGIERTISRPEHFEKCIGSEIEVRLFSPLNGKKTYRGKLISSADDSFSIESGGENIEFPKKDVSKIKTVFEW